MQPICLTKKNVQLKEKKKKSKKEMNFHTEKCDSCFGVTDVYADLESHSSTQRSPAVLRERILQGGSGGKEPQRSVPAQEEMQCAPSQYGRIRPLITMLATGRGAHSGKKKGL